MFPFFPHLSAVKWWDWMPTTKNLFSHSSSGQKFKIKVFGGLVSEGSRRAFSFTSSWLPMAANSPWFAVAPSSLCLHHHHTASSSAVCVCMFSRGLHMRMQLLDLEICYHLILTSYKCKNVFPNKVTFLGSIWTCIWWEKAFTPVSLAKETVTMVPMSDDGGLDQKGREWPAIRLRENVTELTEFTSGLTVGHKRIQGWHQDFWPEQLTERVEFSSMMMAGEQVFKARSAVLVWIESEMPQLLFQEDRLL